MKGAEPGSRGASGGWGPTPELCAKGDFPCRLSTHRCAVRGASGRPGPNPPKGSRHRVREKNENGPDLSIRAIFILCAKGDLNPHALSGTSTSS